MSIWQNVLPGVDGKSPYISEDKRWMVWSDADQKYYDAGPAVPVKGEDYWTDDEREELVKEAAKDVGIKVDELVARAEIALTRAETAAEKAEEATEKIEGSAALIDEHTQEIAAAQTYIEGNSAKIETMSAFSVIVRGDAWQGESAPYTQRIETDADGRSLAWITPEDKCDIPVGEPTHNIGEYWNNDLYLQYMGQFGCIKCVRTENGGLVFICPEEKPVWGELKIYIKMLNRR